MATLHNTCRVGMFSSFRVMNGSKGHVNSVRIKRDPESMDQVRIQGDVWNNETCLAGQFRRRAWGV